MAVKRITIRVSPSLHDRARQAASKRQESLNEFAVRALEDAITREPASASHSLLDDLSALLAPAAQAQEITEDEMLAHLHDVRRKLWQERYRQVVEDVQRKAT